MLVVDGYKMTQGEATIQLNGQEIHTDGVFLFKPDDGLWHMAPNRDFPWGYTFTWEELKEIREAKA